MSRCFSVKLAERPRQQQIVIALDHGQRRLQFVRGRRQEHRLLTIHFLQPQIGGEQISIRDLPFLQQLLDGDLGRRIGHRLRFGGKLELDEQPVGIGEPLHTCFRVFLAALQVELYFMLTGFNC